MGDQKKVLQIQLFLISLLSCFIVCFFNHLFQFTNNVIIIIGTHFDGITEKIQVLQK